MDMSGKDLLKLAKKENWIEVRIEGSHHIMRKDGKEITIPVHGSKSVKKVY